MVGSRGVGERGEREEKLAEWWSREWTADESAVEYFETKPKPTKLNEVLLQTELADLPNVKVYEARVRPWDKERMVGRERPFEKAVAFRYPFETVGKA